MGPQHCKTLQSVAALLRSRTCGYHSIARNIICLPAAVRPTVVPRGLVKVCFPSVPRYHSSKVTSEPSPDVTFTSKFGNSFSGISSWMKGFYQSPGEHAKYIPHALKAMAALPANEQLLTGVPSISTAWFLSKAFKLLPPDERVHIFFDLSTSMGTLALPENTDTDGQLDTILRSFYLMNEPEMDAFLASHVETCLADLRSAEASAKPEEKEYFAMNELCIQSLLPADEAHQRQEIWAWPVPAFDLDAFELTLSSPFSLYTCTRQAFFDCQRLRILREHYPPEYDRALPLTASLLTGAIHDALWSVFFATGHRACIFRLLDLASASFQRYRDLRSEAAGRAASNGDAAVVSTANSSRASAVDAAGGASDEQSLQELLALMQTSAQHDVRQVVQQLPTRNPSAIIAIMAGLAASWSLVENARSHAAVATILSTTLGQLTARSLAGSLAPEEARVLNILQIIMTAAREGGAGASI